MRAAVAFLHAASNVTYPAGIVLPARVRWYDGVRATSTAAASGLRLSTELVQAAESVVTLHLPGCAQRRLDVAAVARLAYDAGRRGTPELLMRGCIDIL